MAKVSILCLVFMALNGCAGRYFFMSAEASDCHNVRKSITGAARGIADIPDNFTAPSLHGPYRTRFSASRALRKFKTQDSCRVYYTKIFPM